jgi:hypothetical protein
MLNRLELGEADRLTEMIEAVREALLECLAGLEDCNSRTRHHWRQTQTKASSRSEELNKLDLQKTALQRETARWSQKIRWLQELCIYLEQKQRTYQAPHVSKSEG